MKEVNINFNKVKKIISDLFGVNQNLILPTAHLSNDLNLTLIEITDLVTYIAKQFDFSIPEEFDIKSIQTVENLLDMIEQYSDEI